MQGKAKMLRIYVGENVRWHGQPLYKALVNKLKQSGLAGATVLRGVEGYGKQKVLHTTRLLELSADLPMAIECVDTAEKIDGVMPEISAMVDRGLVCTFDVNIVKWD